MRNPYEVLGVAKNADQDAIRKAYKALARKYHPDRNKSANAEAKFKEVTAANEMIGDEATRKLYDEFGEAGTKPGFDAERVRAASRGGFPGGGFPGGGPFPGGFSGGAGPGHGYDFDFGDGTTVEDLFGMFNEGRQRPRERRGRTQHATMAVDPMLAIVGGETTIVVPRPGGPNESLKVRIPAGVSDGGTLKLRGQGLPPPGGGECGDLVIKLHVPPHPLLRRDGDDLELDVPITVLEAMKGASITVPTPTGDVKVTVPAGVTTGTRLRLKGRGIQKSPPGDLYLVVRPVVPDSTDPEVVAAAERIEKAYTKDVRAGLVLE